jgi:hypothetical protein
MLERPFLKILLPLQMLVIVIFWKTSVRSRSYSFVILLFLPRLISILGKDFKNPMNVRAPAKTATINILSFWTLRNDPSILVTPIANTLKPSQVLIIFSCGAFTLSF